MKNLFLYYNLFIFKAGGQDDMILIYSLELSKLIVRCQGHNSWVFFIYYHRKIIGYFY